VLPADVLFDQNSSYFSVATLPRLREIFKEIAKRAPRVVIIVGHSDNTGSEDYNVWLSNRRAQRVAEMLRQETAEAFEVQADGRGAVEPRAANDTDEGRAQNRRVEIQFEPTAR
jgi:outer membrane protein OmpA-like peptidoglycan-associated protein